MPYTYGGKYDKEKRARDPLPEGNHELVIVAVEEKVSSAGNDMIQLMLKGTDEHYQDSAYVYFYLVLGTEWTEQNLGALLDSMDKDPMAGGEIDFESWKDETLEAQITHEKYEGVKRAKIRNVLPRFTTDEKEQIPF